MDLKYFAKIQPKNLVEGANQGFVPGVREVITKTVSTLVILCESNMKQ